MRVDDLVRLYPEAFHMAAAGSWASIRDQGLLSTAALRARWGAEGPTDALRSESVVLEDPQLGRAVIRDQKPIHRPSLEAALDGEMTVEEWLAELNSRVFFFVDRTSLVGLMRSPAYRTHEHDVLTIDMASLVAHHEREIQLAGINTGFAQPHNHVRRGRDTFQSIADYPHPSRATLLKSRRELVELCIPGSVPCIADHVLSVERMQAGEVLSVIEQRTPQG